MRNKAGAIMRETRRQTGMTIVELSRRTGIPQAEISQFELGLKMLPTETISVLVRALS